MPMYALATLHLIHLTKLSVQQVWYADATAAGRLADLRAWWDDLVSVGPQFLWVLNMAIVSKGQDLV